MISWVGGADAPRRWLHPLAWWAWAGGLAIAASRTTNPLLLALIVCCCTLVVHARRSDAPWSASFALFVRLGMFVLVIRVLGQVAFGANIGVTPFIWLPSAHLPSWLAGVRLGGPVTAESVLFAVYAGLQLATILICIGAANSLASPSRLLKVVPAALYQVGVAVVVALTFAPQLAVDVDRVRTTRRLRGRATTGVRAFAGAVVPVLEGSLERSVTLAAAMDSRGYGRRGQRTRAQQMRSGVGLLIGIAAICVGLYAFVSAGAPALLGLPLLFGGCAVALISMWSAARSSIRSTYRRDRWGWSETATACSGLIAAAGMSGAAWLQDPNLHTSVDPIAWPTLPLNLCLCVVVSVAPAVLTPRPPRSMPEPPIRAVATRELIAR